MEWMWATFWWSRISSGRGQVDLAGVDPRPAREEVPLHHLPSLPSHRHLRLLQHGGQDLCLGRCDLSIFSFTSA